MVNFRRWIIIAVAAVGCSVLSVAALADFHIMDMESAMRDKSPYVSMYVLTAKPINEKYENADSTIFYGLKSDWGVGGGGA